jgi:hypothetical protein
MAKIIWTPDRRYCAADQDDGNFVVYSVDGTPLWDRWSYEATKGADVAPPAPAPPHPSGGLHLIKVTDERDGELVNRGYSYWSQAYVENDRTYVFCGHVDGNPRFFCVIGDIVTRLGPLLEGHYLGTGEGLYWSRDGRVHVCAGSQLKLVNPFTGEEELIYDAAAEGHPDWNLWQAHSSDDGRVHSATVRIPSPSGPYPAVGTLIVRGGVGSFYPAEGELDESQVSSDGAYLLIKESHGSSDDDNRLVTLATGEVQRLTKSEGSLGHSDLGLGYAIGADRANGTCAFVDFTQPLRAGRPLFRTWNMGHVSVKGGRCLLTDAEALSLVAFDGSGVTKLVDHGMVGSDYDHQVMANLDLTGRVAAYLSNAAGRMDLYLLEL